MASKKRFEVDTELVALRQEAEAARGAYARIAAEAHDAAGRLRYEESRAVDVADAATFLDHEKLLDGLRAEDARLRAELRQLAERVRRFDDAELAKRQKAELARAAAYFHSTIGRQLATVFGLFSQLAAAHVELDSLVAEAEMVREEIDGSRNAFGFIPSSWRFLLLGDTWNPPPWKGWRQELEAAGFVITSVGGED